MKSNFLLIVLGIVLLASGCEPKINSPVGVDEKKLPERFLVVLGVVQDAGYPQIGCTRKCCRSYWEGRETKKQITCLALVDRKANQYWLFEATPDITQQLAAVQPYLLTKDDFSPDGILLTHAHIGHYSGLMQLGREAMGAKAVPVWAMPRLDSFLRNNGPWSQLVSLDNIHLHRLKADSSVFLNDSLKVTPVKVPHRDEFSETVGFMIESNRKKILFIPDIDKWEKWEKDIQAEIGKADLALLDGTFYQNGELPGRDMKEVPHPFVEESIQLFSSVPSSEKSKIIFIHFNHTNPLLKKESAANEKLKATGMGVAEEGMLIAL